jgi:hypothetical protein
MPTWLSDCLCQLVYGGGISSRALFTDDERHVIHAQRPVLLCGIDDFVRRGDLRDRCVFLELPSIAPFERRTEEEFWSAFHVDYPRILGGVLHAVAGALGALPSVHLTALPRMADHARWGEATGRALGWGPDQFRLAYDDNRIEATMSEIADSPVASALAHLAIRYGSHWSGSPAQLYAELQSIVGNKIAASARWPKTVAVLSNELRRLAPKLRLHGLNINFGRRCAGRMITVASESTALMQRLLGD